jgi:hypothetical protein
MADVPVGLLALLVVLPVCSFVPGFLLLQRFALAEEVRLALSVAVSLGLIYLADFALFLAGAGGPMHVAVVAAVVAAGWARRGEIRAFLAAPAIRDLLLLHALFAAWLVLLSLFVQSFSGAGWMGDWLEHFERARLFCNELPLDATLYGKWSLTARPPLQNVVVAFFMQVAGTDFPTYQLATVLVDSLEFVGAATFALALSRGHAGRGAALLFPLAALLCLNPSVVENATYTWTRSLTNFFLLLAAALYVHALRDRSAPARRWAWLVAGLAAMTHYSAVPYVVGLGVVELWLVAHGRVAPQEFLLGAALGAIPAVPWFALAAQRFGLAGTFLANSTVMWNGPLGAGGWAARALHNVWSTLVPHPLRHVEPFYEQELAIVNVRDWAFLLYQVSLLPMMGSIGGLLVAWKLGAEGWRRLCEGRRELPFLVATFLATVLLLGIAVVPSDEPYGAAQICLQPLAVAGIAWLATGWAEMGRWLRGAVWGGLAADAVLGIAIHFRVEGFGWDEVTGLSPMRFLVNEFALGNLGAKGRHGDQFLGDLPCCPIAIAIVGAALAGLVAYAAWRAWHERPARAAAPR